MANKNKKSKFEDETEVDPFDELNEFDDDLTIETEKDFFDELEQSDLDDVPEYDSESGQIIEASEEDDQILTRDNKVVEEKISLIETIDEVEFNNNKTEEKKSEKKSSLPKPKRRSKNLNSKDNTGKDDTKVIDNVKVDEDGVPLLNQFDTDKIKESEILPKIKIRRVSISKILMIVIGLIVSIIGIIEATKEVVSVSDHVMYGEHNSMAMGLIFLGIIIIILAFYKEILKLSGLNSINEVVDDVESSPRPEKNNDKSEKK